MATDPPLPPILKFFLKCEAIRKTHGRLPHWQQDNATYFITFRLADSIPAHLLDHWRDERQAWLKHHPKPWSPETESEYHERFSAKIDGYLDQGFGSCALRDPANATLVADSIRHFDRNRYLLHSWVIMPNHVHLLLSLNETVGLGATVSTWKRYTATRINQREADNGAFWQKDYFDRLIRDWNHFRNVARYIRNNPIKANLPTGTYLLYEAPWIQYLFGE